MKKDNLTKKEYQRLRTLTCEALWTREVPLFNQGDPAERMRRVAVVRAVGVVFSASGTPAQCAEARSWLKELLRDPEEKIRRYALTALPKLGASEEEEESVLALLSSPATERESRSLSRTLEKIGGSATLTAGSSLSPGSRQKVKANVARRGSVGKIHLDRTLSGASSLLIHLRCRQGLESILEEEVRAEPALAQSFSVRLRHPGLLVLAQQGPFSLGDIFRLRCFHSLGLVSNGQASASSSSDPEVIAREIVSPPLRRALETFSEGPIRYRLEFLSQTRQGTAVRKVAERVHSLCPSFLNDPLLALWQVNIYAGPHGRIEMSPRLRPDPRFAYRVRDLPAASHPPLAACMVRLAGVGEDQVVWDPFCGSGVELIECVMRGGVRKIIGSDLSQEALEAATANLAAAFPQKPEHEFHQGDFRDCAKLIPPGSVSLMISNPPMGRRVSIPDLPGLFRSVFSVAEKTLSPGAHLVLTNPLPAPSTSRVLRLIHRQKIDLGGFHVHLEKYKKRP